MSRVTDLALGLAAVLSGLAIIALLTAGAAAILLTVAVAGVADRLICGGRWLRKYVRSAGARAVRFLEIAHKGSEPGKRYARNAIHRTPESTKDS